MTVAEASARMLMRVLVAIFTAAVLALFGSAFSTAAVTPHLRLILGAIAIAAYFRPSHSLLVLAAVLPLSGAFLSGISPGTRNAEALILAFLSGALIRGWTLHRFRGLPSDRLHTAVLVFGLIVAASCIEQLWFIQIQRDFPGAFLSDLFTYANRYYLSSLRGLGTLFHAMLLVEGLALLLFSAHYCRIDSAFPRRLIFAVMAGAVAAALLNVSFFVTELIATGNPREHITRFLIRERWSAHIGDVNATGAFFAMALFIAIVAAYKNRRAAAYAVPVAALMAAVVWLSGSRTAIVIVAVVGTLCAIAAIRHIRLSAKTLVLGVAIVAIVAVVLAKAMALVLANPEAVEAVTIRRQFLGVTARMLESQPLFGLGVGQYSLWSRAFMPAGFEDVYYARENAHNNFAQIAGELGLSGIAAFVLLLATCLHIDRATRHSRANLIWPVLAGLLTFILTWLGNHPLLVPAVAYPFWLLLGITAGLGTSGRRAPFAVPAIVGCVLVPALFLPSRVNDKLALIDVTRITYGMSDARVMRDRARFFVARDATRIVLPLRARSVPEQPLAIDIAIDKAHATTVHLANDRWTEWTLDLPATAGRGAHQIDLRLRDPAESSGAAPQSYRIDIGQWSIIPRPNG